MKRPTDPVESVIFDALVAHGVEFTMEGTGHRLDFYLPWR